MQWVYTEEGMLSILLAVATSDASQVTKVAVERDALKRAQFRLNYARSYSADQLVFVDESSFDRRTPYRRRGWTVSGRRVFKNAFFVRGRRYVLKIFNYKLPLTLSQLLPST